MAAHQQLYRCLNNHFPIYPKGICDTPQQSFLPGGQMPTTASNFTLGAGGAFLRRHEVRHLVQCDIGRSSQPPGHQLFLIWSLHTDISDCAVQAHGDAKQEGDVLQTSATLSV
ncbi:hypothetical protein DPX16_5635 [Anabarilius grahami]|uniref:Uncharacterized protein n=1 Tax=Anabarilius grahami TaxID=495550 RepID=A0A3N0YQU7_ANAGA|nr:hypothetical protein DPX16_5635 [Anabarilius grahami]